MNKYRVDIVERLESTIWVEADDEDEAYELALEELAEDFCAPYHTSCDVQKYTVTKM